jgi:anion-transporting  ArsA/GET3 family ATPase
MLLSRELIFVTGKGGVGKTTVAAGLGMALAAAGRRTIVCEVGAQRRLPALFGLAQGDPLAADFQHDEGTELALDDHLWATSIDPNRALREWLATQLPSKGLVELLTRSNLFQYFTAAAPGARELVTVTKVWELAQAKRWEKKAQPYDVVVVDLPASGHGVGLLRTARTFADVARVGPIASQAGRVRDTVEDRSRSAFVAVALPGELPVTETLELEERVVRDLRRPVDAIVVNALLPRRWASADLEALEAAGTAVPAQARRAARSETARTKAQQTQLGRLRREATAPVVTLPFVPVATLGREQVASLGAELAGKL